MIVREYAEDRWEENLKLDLKNIYRT